MFNSCHIHVYQHLQSYVICEPAAATVIKSYSPNLMVAPLLRESNTPYPQDPSPPTPESAASPILEMLSRLHVLVIGPGLGRDELMQAICKKVITAAREQRIPIVLDADALQLVNAEPDFVRGWKEVILTPNVIEFARLAKAVNVDVAGVPKEEACARVSEKLGGVCIIQKGDVDYISDGKQTWICDLEGGKKRSGGQGDTLTGSIGTFLCWRRAYLDKLWDVEGSFGEDELVMMAAFGGAAITRECSRLAFIEKGRALQASDVGDKVPTAFLNIIGEKEESKL
jgi:ATP-dependent NAD(P)H-hydrate dehydratase